MSLNCAWVLYYELVCSDRFEPQNISDETHNSYCFHLHNLLFTRTCSSINGTQSVGKSNDDYDGNDNDNYNVNDNNNNVNDCVSNFDAEDYQNKRIACEIMAKWNHVKH